MRASAGLIPAHAGKTVAPFFSIDSTRAHPRSRGENFAAWSNVFCGLGSSPLTRGKRPHDSGSPRGVRLIPAHAGKTVGRGLGR